MTPEASLKVEKIGGEKRNKNTEYDVQLLFEGEELDITIFAKKLENQFDDIIKARTEPYAQELFNKWKSKYISKNSTGSQIAKIKSQLDKANNQLKNISEGIDRIENK